VRENVQDKMQDKVAVLIAGPTASGKSALAVAVAERIDGVVVNTDSMQVYRDLMIITARPGAAETARVPHLLYGHMDAAENYSVGRFLGDAAAALEAARAQGRIPIFTGGSGLYFKALTTGLAAIPPVPPDIRAAVRSKLEARPVAHRPFEGAGRTPASPTAPSRPIRWPVARDSSGESRCPAADCGGSGLPSTAARWPRWSAHRLM